MEESVWPTGFKIFKKREIPLRYIKSPSACVFFPKDQESKQYGEFLHGIFFFFGGGFT